MAKGNKTQRGIVSVAATYQGRRARRSTAKRANRLTVLPNLCSKLAQYEQDTRA